MQSRAINILNSYDLVAKSIPGVVLLLGVGTLLPPSTPILGVEVGDTLAEYALTLITALLLGLFLGEGVHTLAILLEKLAYWLGYNTMSVYRQAELLIAGGLECVAAGRDRHYDDLVSEISNKLKIVGFLLYIVGLLLSSYYLYINGASVVGIVIYLVVVLVTGATVFRNRAKIRGWIDRRYWGLHNIAKSHRRLFVSSIIWNYNPEVPSPWEVEEKGEVYDCFTQCIKNEFGVDLTRPPGEESPKEEYPDEEATNRILRLYPLVTSDLSVSEASLSSRFQAIYSFCRSMWVVFLIITALYVLLIVPYYINNSLLWSASSLKGSSTSDYPIFIAVPFFSSIIFMIGSGFYKRHYIDYLMADFCTEYRNSLPFGNQFK